MSERDPIGIRIYDRKNDPIYDDLISRGRKLAEELHVDTGIFRGCRRPTDSFVNHTWAIRIIAVPQKSHRGVDLTKKGSHDKLLSHIHKKGASHENRKGIVPPNVQSVQL